MTIGYGATIAVQHIPQFAFIAMYQISKLPCGNRSCDDDQCILLGVALTPPQAFCTSCVSQITMCALDRQTIREVIAVFK